MHPRLPVISVLLCLAAPAPAQAVTTVAAPASPAGDVTVTGSPLGDLVTVRGSADRVRIQDAAGVVTAPSAVCTARSATEVECSTRRPVAARLGAGNDRFTVAGGWSADVAPRLDGEDGDDRFEVGPAPAAGVDGSAGTDTVSYAGGTLWDGFLIDLGAGSTSAGGVLAEIEAVEGSRSADHLRGDARSNTLRGLEGDDTIDGGPGADTVDAGPGDDELFAIDGSTDALGCGDGFDTATMEGADTTDGCEQRQGPGVSALADVGLPVVTSSRPAPRARVVRPRGAKRGVIAIRSRPAADGANTRIGARVRSPNAGVVRMTVLDGDRVVGATERATTGGQDVTLTVALDAGVRKVVADTRHVELAVLLELVVGGVVTVAEEHQATLVEPPPFVRGARGKRKRGGFGVQRLQGSARSDHLSGDSGDDTLRGAAGNDLLEGGTGNDRLAGSAGNDKLDGYDGDDRLMGGAGDDLLVETRFGDDTLDGGAGDDWIVGGRGSDHISGGPGDDVIFGGSAPDTIDCGAGDDTVFVNLESERRSLAGCETVLEEDDIPSIPCGEGDGTDDGETMLGTDAADVCNGAGGADDVEGAGGSDRLFGGAGDDRAFGRFGNDQMFGEAGDDELEGGRGDDRLSGGAGNDQLNGGYGRDRLDAGAGNDTLISRGGGRDQVECGPGRDVAVVDRGDRLSGCETVRYR
jgi:Ca2+-binding RTX toxin-like protein